MDMELCQLDRRYEPLRSRSATRERRLLASLAEVGQQTPIIVVRAVPEDADVERWVVVDGYKRLRALGRLGQDIVSAAEWTLAEPDALLLERVLRMGDEDSPIEQGWFLLELTERFNLGLEELARRLDRTKSWVSRRIGLVKHLPEPTQQHVRSGAIGAHAAMKYLLPLARANAADCAQLSNNIAPERPTSRQLGQLYATYAAGTASTRQLVVNQPVVVLRARAESEQGSSTTAPIEQVLEDLRIIAAVAQRAWNRLGRGAVDGANSDERGGLRHGLEEAGAAVRRLEKQGKRELSEEKSDAGSRDSVNDSTPE
jgi:ParB-like chromosome segregation protein Spo0J